MGISITDKIMKFCAAKEEDIIFVGSLIKSIIYKNTNKGAAGDITVLSKSFHTYL